jgi:hypothetical protein
VPEAKPLEGKSVFDWPRQARGSPQILGLAGLAFLFLFVADAPVE